MLISKPHKAKYRIRPLLSVFLSAALILSLSACLETAPTDTQLETPNISDAPTDTTGFRDPSVPIINPGEGLPDIGDSSTSTDDEVDCEQAEDLCDAGDWACDDIADYCDYGPDDGSELPDDWDWDQ